MIKILFDGEIDMSNYSTEEKTVNMDEQANGNKPERSYFRDYDDEPYGDDNVLVRASKRRSFLIPSSNL